MAPSEVHVGARAPSEVHSVHDVLTRAPSDVHSVHDVHLTLHTGQDGARAGRNAEGPTHLVVLMHGVMGRSSHMDALGEAARRRLGSDALVVSPSCYARLNSLRGTRNAGSAVFAEMQAIVQEHTSLKCVSLCGYSFGGIVAMWVAALLHERACLGLVPVNFITVACPHLGATEPTGGGLLAALRRQFIRSGGVQTGAELSHGDPSALLLHLTRPCSAGYAGMKAFARRATYANLRGDRTVPFETAFFPARREAGDTQCPGTPTPPSNPAQPRAFETEADTDLPGRWRVAGDRYPHVLLVATDGPDAAGARGAREEARRAGGAGDGRGGAVAADCDKMPPRTAAMMAALLPLVLAWLVLSVPVALLIVCVGRLWRGMLSLSGEDALTARDLHRMSLAGHAAGGGGKSGGEGEGARTAHEAGGGGGIKGSETPRKAGDSPEELVGMDEGRTVSRREVISARLNSLGWEKHGVLFTYTADGLWAVHTHGHIIVRYPGLNDVGQDVVEHIAEHLLHGA